MSILFTFFGCLLLYSKSQHFPEFLKKTGYKAKQNKFLVKICAYILFAISLINFIYQLGIATGLIVFFLALIFGLALTIFLLPLNKRYLYILAGFTILITIIENTL